MVRKWLDSAQYLFIPLIVQDTPGYFPPPADYVDHIRRRVHFDPDPDTNEDRSPSSYVSSVSYGLASLDATVVAPVTLTKLSSTDNPTSLAINAQPDAHKYEYLAVVYPPNSINAGSGMAQPGKFVFDPARPSNRTRARCRFRHDAPLGTWAMEVIHNVTDITDFYNNFQHPGRFEEMAAAEGSHPTSFTKAQAGWIKQAAPFNPHAGLWTHPGSTRTYLLHAVGLASRPQDRVAGIKVQADGSNRYLFIEARLKCDRWESGFSGSSGIPAEGVVIYEFAPENDPWPKITSPGPWSPLQLRKVLAVGETFTHHDTWTRMGGPKDYRTNRGRHRTITVTAAVAGGFRVEISTDD